MKRENPVGSEYSAPPLAKHDENLAIMVEANPFGGATVLHCEGRLIFSGDANALAARVSEMLPTVRRMVVNLAGVSSIDSAGLGELVLLHMWADAAGYTLKFASPNKSVRALLELTNLISVFDVYGSVPEAAAAIRHEQLQTA